MQSAFSDVEVEVDFDIDSPMASKVKRPEESERPETAILEDNCSDTEAEHVEEELIREIVN